MPASSSTPFLALRTVRSRIERQESGCTALTPPPPVVLAAQGLRHLPKNSPADAKILYYGLALVGICSALFHALLKYHAQMCASAPLQPDPNSQELAQLTHHPPSRRHVHDRRHLLRPPPRHNLPATRPFHPQIHNHPPHSNGRRNRVSQRHGRGICAPDVLAAVAGACRLEDEGFDPAAGEVWGGEEEAFEVDCFWDG
jgi:hypothetical protein